MGLELEVPKLVFLHANAVFEPRKNFYSFDNIHFYSIIAVSFGFFSGPLT
jgi:hypothetical protein